MRNGILIQRFIWSCLTLFIFCISSTQSHGQELKTYLKYENDKLLIRWNPESPQIWENGLKSGYVVEKFQEGNLVYTSEVIKAEPFKIVDSTPDDSETNEFLHVCLVHIDKVDQAMLNEEFPSSKYSKEDILDVRYELSNYLQNSDFKLTLYAGLGYQDDSVISGVDYTYKISSPEGLFDEVSLSFNSAKYTKPILPELTAKWDNQRAYLKWNTVDYKLNFYGWKLFISEDGFNYQLTDSTIMVNLSDTSQNELFHYFEEEIIVDENEKMYHFRLQGFDHFGGKTDYYSEVSGKASQGIGLSPVIKKITQNSDNTCTMEWSILDRFKDKVKEYRLYAGPSWDGPYVVDTVGLSPMTNKLTREIIYTATYWRIVAIDQEGKEFSSFPKMIMSIDTIAPAVPANIESSIDSNGIVQLTWDQNYEEDFIGYKVFYTHDTLHPYLLDHDQYVEKSEYSDTLFLKTYKKYTYYKIISVDGRNNRSDYSEIVVVKKPDILAPVSPNFRDISNYEGQVILEWNNSSSPDVLSCQLYRKKVKSTDQWELLDEWNVSDTVVVSFVDSTLIPEISYAYLMTATDEDGNVSDPSDPVVGEAFKTLASFPVNSFEVIKSEDDNLIKWDFDFKEIFEVWIYKRVEGEKPRLLRKVEPPVLEFLEKGIDPDLKSKYFLQIYFNNGRTSDYSLEKEAK